MTEERLRWRLLFPGDRVVYAILGLVLLYTLAFSLNYQPFFLVQAIIGTSLVIFIPGFLILGLGRIELTTSETAIYSVLLSILYTAGIGVLMHIAIWSRVFTFSLGPSVSVYLSSLVVLIGLYHTFGEYPVRNKISLNLSKEVAVAAMFPVLMVIGAFISLQHSVQAVVLLALSFGLLIGAIFIASPPEKLYRPLILWLFALGLLLQRPLSRQYLGGGDSRYELYVSRLSLAMGGWDPSLAVSKTSVLFLTIVRPMQHFITGLSQVDVLRFIHPITFAFIAPALYLVFCKVVDEDTAFTSVLVYSALYPFYVILSMNSRSGMALLFFIGFIAVGLRHRAQIWTAAVSFAFLPGVVISHYGVALVLIIITGVSGVAWLIGRGRFWPSKIPEPLSYLGVYSTATVAYYAYISSGHVIDLVAGIAIDAVLNAGSLLGASSSAGHGVNRSFDSLTYQLIRVEYVLILGLVGIGCLIWSLDYLEKPDWSFINRLPSSPVDTKAPAFYFILSIGVTSFIGLSVAPISPMGIARVLIISLAILAPILLLPIRAIGHWAKNRGRIAQVLEPRRIFVVVFVAILVIQSGLMGFMLDERTPQPYHERERLETGEYPGESIHFFGYHQSQNVQTAGWLHTHGDSDRTILGNGYSQRLPSQYFYTLPPDFSKPPGQYESLGNPESRQPGDYVYLSPWTETHQKTMVKLYPDSTNYRQMEFRTLREVGSQRWDEIYTTGNSSIHIF